MAAQTLPPSLSARLEADVSRPRDGERRAPGIGERADWVSALRLPKSNPRGGSHFGGSARAARGSVQTARPASSGGAKRRQPQRRGMAPVPRPRTHAGFMAAGSAMPRRARRTPTSLGRAGEDSESQKRAARKWTRRLRRFARSRPAARLRAQVSSRLAHFKRANQHPPAGKGRVLPRQDSSAGSAAHLLGDRRGKGARSLGVCASRLEPWLPI